MAKKNTDNIVEETSTQEVLNVVEPTNEELIEKFETEVETQVEEVKDVEPIIIPVVETVEETKVEPVIDTNILSVKNEELYKTIKSTHFGKLSNESVEEYVDRVFSSIILNSIEYNENLDKLNSVENKIKIKNYSFIFDEYLESIKQGFSNPNYCIEMETAIGLLKQKISTL